MLRGRGFATAWHGFALRSDILSLQGNGLAQNSGARALHTLENSYGKATAKRSVALHTHGKGDVHFMLDHMETERIENVKESRKEEGWKEEGWKQG